MNEIKMKGRLVYFDKVNWINECGILIPKNCHLIYPGIVPVVWNFDLNNAYGYGIVTKDELGLVCEVNIFESNPIGIWLKDKEIGVGCYYTNIKNDLSKSGIRTIQSCHLLAISLTLCPVDEDYKLVLVEEE